MTKLEYFANLVSPLVTFRIESEYSLEEKECFIEQKSYEYFLNIYETLIKVQNFIHKENLKELEETLEYYVKLLYNIINTKYNNPSNEVLKIQFIIKGLFLMDPTLAKYIN